MLRQVEVEAQSTRLDISWILSFRVSTSYPHILPTSQTKSTKKEILKLYRVFHNDGPKVFAYCSKNMITSDILSLLGAHQMWSI